MDESMANHNLLEIFLHHKMPCEISGEEFHCDDLLFLILFVVICSFTRIFLFWLAKVMSEITFKQQVLYCFIPFDEGYLRGCKGGLVP